MNRSQIEDAIESRRAFLIRRADGRGFLVPTRDHILLSRQGTFLTVMGDDETVNSIPLIMIASVQYQPSGAAAAEM